MIVDQYRHLTEQTGAVPTDPSQRKRYRDRVRYMQMTPQQREAYWKRNREYKRIKRGDSAISKTVQPVRGETSMSTNDNTHLPTESSTTTEGTLLCDDK